MSICRRMFSTSRSLLSHDNPLVSVPPQLSGSISGPQVAHWENLECRVPSLHTPCYEISTYGFSLTCSISRVFLVPVLPRPSHDVVACLRSARSEMSRKWWLFPLPRGVWVNRLLRVRFFLVANANLLDWLSWSFIVYSSWAKLSKHSREQ